eukprot:635887-Amorphochlora_amoeboformis.AAC.2
MHTGRVNVHSYQRPCERACWWGTSGVEGRHNHNAPVNGHVCDSKKRLCVNKNRVYGCVD